MDTPDQGGPDQERLNQDRNETVTTDSPDKRIRLALLDQTDIPQCTADPEPPSARCTPYACKPAGPCPADSDVRMDLRTIKHELGNKLGPMQFALNIIRKSREADPEHFSDTEREMLSLLEDSVMHIWGLMDQIRRRLDSVIPAQISDPKENPEFSLVDFSATLVAEIEYWGKVRKDVKINAQIQPGIMILGNIIKLQEIFANIFKNAIELMKNNSPEDKVLVVRLFPINGALQLTVQDRGPGILPENKDRLFRKHFSTKGGDGIGLFISRNRAAEMGGSLWLVDNHEREELKAAANLDTIDPRGATAILELPISIIRESDQK